MSFVRRHALWIDLGASTVLLLVLIALDPATAGSGYDIIALELAGDFDRAAVITLRWLQSDLLERARWSVRIDFLFIIAYVTLLWLACRRGAKVTAPAHAWTLRLAAYLAPVAGLLDVCENVALLRILDLRITHENVRFASLCAQGKFGLIILIAATLVPVGAILLRRRIRVAMNPDCR